jgi:hypothetical protein
VELASAAIINGLQIFPEIITGIRSYCERKYILQLQELVGKAADGSLAYNEIPVQANQRFPWDV